jgi:cation-transporting ATPase E
MNRALHDTSRSVAAILRANLLTRFNAMLGALLVVIVVVGPIQDALFGIVLVANAAIGCRPGICGPNGRWTGYQ